MDTFWVIFLVILAIAVIGLGPFITLWAINSLFQLQIAYTFLNWVATVWLSSVAAGITSYGKK